jgi:hypothetical protein
LSYDECASLICKNDTIANLYNIGMILKNTIIKSFPVDEPYDTHQMVAVYMIYANKFVAEKLMECCPKNGIFIIACVTLLN